MQENNKIATLRIYGDIVEQKDMMLDASGIAENVITPEIVADFIEQNKDAEKFIIKIDSRGGSVDAGFTIHDLLVNSGKQIETIGEGKIYSIATIILLAGSVRKMTQNASFLIHNPFIPEYALASSYESSDLLKLSEELKYEENKILDFYVNKTGGDKETISEMMSVETKMSAEKAKELGFITEILTPIKAYAIFNLKSNKKMSKELEAIKKDVSENKTVLDKIFNKLFGTKNEDGTAVVNLDVTTTDEKTITVVTENETPSVGDVVNIAGEVVPDGSYELTTGETLVVVDSIITEIMPKAEEPNELEIEIENLKTELQNSKAENEILKASIGNSLKAKDEVKTEFEAMKKNYDGIVNRLSQIESVGKPPKVENFQAQKTSIKKSREEMLENRK